MINLLDYQRFIHGQVGKRIGFANPDIEDVIQEVYINLLRTLHKYDPARGKPMEWIGWRIRSIVHDWMDKTSRKKLYFINDLKGRIDAAKEEDTNDLDIMTPMDKLTPEVLAAARQELIGVNKSLKRVPERWKRAFMMRVIEDKDHHEVAKEMGTTTIAVDKLVFRTRKILREEK